MPRTGKKGKKGNKAFTPIQTSTPVSSQSKTWAWTVSDDYALTNCLIGGDDELPLVIGGINKHFQMLLLIKRFHKLTDKTVSSGRLWSKLNEKFDMEKVDEQIGNPFSDKFKEFELPNDPFYSNLMLKKRMVDVFEAVIAKASENDQSGKGKKDGNGAGPSRKSGRLPIP